MPVILERSGFTEECFFTFCYSPVRDESGGIAGGFGTVSAAELSPGTTVLLYTDGFTDRPGTAFNRNLERAAGLLAAHRDQPLDQLLHALAQITGPYPADDIALLAIRIR
jgi:Stage II sporulation protein E (SpoIIE)